jgi:hypothetical protein
MGWPESNWDEPPRSVERVRAGNGAIIQLEYHGKVGYAVDGWFAQLVEGEWPGDRELQLLCNDILARDFGGRVEPVEGGNGKTIGADANPDGIGSRRRVFVNTD